MIFSVVTKRMGVCVRQSGESTFQADKGTMKLLVGEVLEKLRKDQCDQNTTNEGSGKTEVEGVGRSWIMQALWGQIMNVGILP